MQVISLKRSHDQLQWSLLPNQQASYKYNCISDTHHVFIPTAMAEYEFILDIPIRTEGTHHVCVNRTSIIWVPVAEGQSVAI